MQHSARDPLRNSEYGRIYRITCTDRPLVDPPVISGAEIKQLFDNLKLPEINARKRSHRELRGRDKEAVISAAMHFARQNEGNERLVLEALWATWGQQQPSLELLDQCLSTEDHRVRAAAVRVVRHCLHLLSDPQAFLLRAAQDEHPRVRLEALAAASWLGGEAAAEILLQVASQKTDRWIRNALNSAILLLKPEVERRIDSGFDSDDLSVDYDKLLTGKLEGALKPKNYRTKSQKFRDRAFSRQYTLGQRVFYEEGSCYTCHRDHGEGIARIYPPLAGSEWATGDPDRLIKLTMHGIWGKIRVRGKIFETTRGVPPMTAIGNFFTDTEVAAVLTYVRNSWGNDASAITEEHVKRMRDETKSRRRFYSPEELIEMHPFAEGSRPPLIEDEPTNEKLEKELLAESLATLVSDAWKQGDAKRGASVFYREKTACATCHDSRADFQLGPKLTAARKQTTAEFLIESILKPSASILDGFQSVTVITDEGVVVSGHLVEKTDETITLSIVSEKGRRRNIPVDSIDETIEAKISTMPAGLARALKNRGEFLDLARFLLEINKGGPGRLRALKKQANIQR